MPTRLMGPCKNQPCPNTRTQSSQYCDGCATKPVQSEVDRGSSAARGYGHKWRKLRLMVIRRDPLCADPFAIGCLAVSRHADHIIPKRSGGEDILENLQGLCDSCHSRKTLLEGLVRFILPADGTIPAFYHASGRQIILVSESAAGSESVAIRAWPAAMANHVWGQGWVKSLELCPARPRVGHAHTLAK